MYGDLTRCSCRWRPKSQFLVKTWQQVKDRRQRRSLLEAFLLLLQMVCRQCLRALASPPFVYAVSVEEVDGVSPTGRSSPRLLGATRACGDGDGWGLTVGTWWLQRSSRATSLVSGR